MPSVMNPYQDTNPIKSETCIDSDQVVSQPVQDACMDMPTSLNRTIEQCVDGVLLLGDYSRKLCIQVFQPVMLLQTCKFPLSCKDFQEDLT